jgi:synaptotagmin-1
MTKQTNKQIIHKTNKQILIKLLYFTKYTDPYVKVSLLQAGKRLKKKKTSTKKGELNPVFNEAISFDLSSELLDNVDLLVLVMHGNDVIGCVLIGSHACITGKELQSWKEMRSDNRPVARWYLLQDPKLYY